MYDVKPELYSQISDLVEAGKYASIEMFVELAVKNQMLLEKTINHKEKKVAISSENLNQDKKEYLRNNVDKKPTTVTPIRLSPDRTSLPIWGLINRITPGKFVLRLLCNMLLKNSSEWINLSEFSEKVAIMAYEARLDLEKYERRLDITRGESIKMAFPMKDPKSKQRFTSTYIGRLRSDSTVDGLLGDLEFAVIKKVQTVANATNSVIGLTENGLKFSQINSPVIDDLLLGQRPILNPLSDEEVLYLLRHIRQVRPGEFQFLGFLYRSIKAGTVKPQQISQLTSQYFNKSDLSRSFVNSLQSGAMARLIEMRLIRIQKEGIYTSYNVQSSNTDFDHILTEPNLPRSES